MHSQFRFKAFLFRCAPFFLLLVSSYSEATPCLYLGANADTRVINRSGEISTPFPTALSAHDCRRLRVVTESVKVYVVEKDGAAPTVTQVAKGPLVPAADLAAPIGSDTLGIIRQIGLVLEGINRTKTGSSRGGEEEYVVASLPSGKLLEPSVDLVLELGPTPDRNLTSFELFQGAKVVFRQIGPAQALRLPASALRSGNQMQWRLEYAGKKYDGQFKVEPIQRMTAIKQSLLADYANSTDPIAEALRFASAFALEGYGWDSRELIRTALGGPLTSK